MWPGPYGEWGSRKYLLAEPRPVLRADGPGLRRHLLQPPFRSRDAARGDDGCAGHGGPVGQGALRRHLLLLAGAHPARRPRSCGRWARRCSSTSRATRCSTAGSRRPARRARGRGRRLHRVLPARPGHAHRPVPRRHPRGVARRAGQVAGPGLLSDASWRTSGGSTRSPAARPEPGPARPAVGAARPAGDVGADRREQRRAARGQRRRARRPGLTDAELAAIDADAVDSGINLWERSSSF